MEWYLTQLKMAHVSVTKIYMLDIKISKWIPKGEQNPQAYVWIVPHQH